MLREWRLSLWMLNQVQHDGLRYLEMIKNWQFFGIIILVMNILLVGIMGFFFNHSGGDVAQTLAALSGASASHLTDPILLVAALVIGFACWERWIYAMPAILIIASVLAFAFNNSFTLPFAIVTRSLALLYSASLVALIPYFLNRRQETNGKI